MFDVISVRYTEKRMLLMISCKVSKAWEDWVLECLYCFEIGQAFWEQCCQDASQISEQLENLNLRSHAFRDFARSYDKMSYSMINRPWPWATSTDAAFITVWSKWAWRHLKSPVYRLFAQPSVQAKTKETSKLRITGLCERNHKWLVDSPHKGPVTRKMFPFDDFMMIW